jgi:hypothetical protein
MGLAAMEIERRSRREDVVALRAVDLLVPTGRGPGLLESRVALGPVGREEVFRSEGPPTIRADRFDLVVFDVWHGAWMEPGPRPSRGTRHHR